MQLARFEPGGLLVPIPAASVGRGGPSQGQVFLRSWQMHGTCAPSCSIAPEHFGGTLWRASVALEEIDYNHRSGGLRSAVPDPVMKAPMEVFSPRIAKAELTPEGGFPFHTFYVAKEPFTNLAVEWGSRGSRMNSCPMYFTLSQFYIQRSPGVE